MRQFQNSDVHKRVWPTLIDPSSGHTVELEPGQKIRLDLPENFADPFLVVVVPQLRKKEAEPLAQEK